MSLTIGSLFAGIGGLELGLEWAGLGPTLWQVEQSAYCRSVLARHWPGAERHEDVCEVGVANLLPVDLICGGFPCQDVSAAGRGAGLAGARSGLWYEFARILEECRPRWVVIENVASGAARWVDAVAGDLGRLGYASLSIPLSASDLGAPHQRARVFLVGRLLADSDDEPRPLKRKPRWREEVARDQGAAPADAHGLGHEARAGGVGEQDTPGRPCALGDAPDSHGEGKLQPRELRRPLGRWTCDADRIWADEPNVARVVHGIPGRVDRTRMLGNSVVPQCAEVIGHVIQELREAP